MLTAYDIRETYTIYRFALRKIAIVLSSEERVSISSDYALDEPREVNFGGLLVLRTILTLRSH